MLASLLLSLREGLEAALIIGIVLAVLRRTHQSGFIPIAWRGAAAAGLLSMLAAIILTLIGAEFEGNGEVIFEGTTMLLAAGLLTWMVFWMQKQARSKKATIENEVLHAAQQGGKHAIFLIAFLSILREGVELAVFLLAARLESNPLETVLGTVIGLAGAALLGMLAFRTTRRLTLKNVFRVTNVFLALFAAGLVAHGVREFIEIGLIPPLVSPVWNLNGMLPEQSNPGLILQALFGYHGSPALSEVIAYLGYFVLLIVGWRYSQSKAAIPIRS
jgi:high-affinity iron transporter